MTSKVFTHYIQMLYSIHDIPMRIFKDGQLMQRCEFSPFPVPDIDRMMLNQLSTNQTHIAVYQTGNLFLYAAIKDKRNQLTVTIGPVRAILPEKETVEEIARFLNKTVTEMASYLDRLPVIPSGKFAEIIAGMNTAINSEIISPDDLYQRILRWRQDTDVIRTVLNREESFSVSEDSLQYSYEIEQELLYYVRSGMVDELKKRWLGIVPERLFALTNDRSLRNAKNHCILGLALITDAAIRAGVPPQTAYATRELYMKQTEQCATLQQIMQLRCTIFCDFAERTRRIQFRKPDSPLISHAVTHILNHIAEDISLAEVADQLHTGRTHLSARFKKEMGLSFTDFVNMQKVEKARELLLFTEKSIVEISAYLSFSSQGYFQTVFKKYTGTTPNAYRKMGNG